MAYSLDDLRSDADKKFKAFEVDGFSLLNLVRLPREDRVRIAELMEELYPEDKKDAKGKVIEKAPEPPTDERALEILNEIFRLASDNKEAVAEFMGQVGDDLVLAMTLFEKWIEETKVGEASGSQK